MKNFKMYGYQDEYTRMHDRTKGSNNGWIYSAYTKHVAPELLDYDRLAYCLNKSTVDAKNFKINRSPEQTTPPKSRDEVMGILSLFRLQPQATGLYHYLKSNFWNFCNFEDYKKEPLTLNKIITAADILYDIKDMHRNTVWEQNLVEAYPLAFRLPPSDIYYIKKMYGGKPNLLETLHFYAETIQNINGGDKSSRMITWLKIKDLGLENSYLGKKVIATEKERFETYFGKEHILYQKLLDKN